MILVSLYVDIAKCRNKSEDEEEDSNCTAVSSECSALWDQLSNANITIIPGFFHDFQEIMFQHFPGIPGEVVGYWDWEKLEMAMLSQIVVPCIQIYAI